MQFKLSALILIVAAAPSLFAAPSREIVQIQRDLALLQEQIRTMQQAQDEKLVRLTTLVEQALQSSSKASPTSAPGTIL